MAITYSDIPQIISDLQSILPSQLTPNQFSALQRVLRKMVDVMQDGAKASDAAAQAALVQKRLFVVNNGSTTQSITFSGTSHSFPAGQVFCCSPEEAAFFRTKAIEKGYNFADSNVTDWSGANGQRKQFYW